MLRPTSACTCPGNTLTFECTVVETMWGVTVWQGSALDNNCTSKDIPLLHSRYSSGNGAQGSCGNFIFAKIIKKENGSYTSQLNVTVSSYIIGKSIECVYDDNKGSTTSIGSLNVTILTGNINFQLVLK